MKIYLIYLIINCSSHFNQQIELENKITFETSITRLLKKLVDRTPMVSRISCSIQKLSKGDPSLYITKNNVLIIF